MNDKEYKDLCKKVRRIADEWRDIIGLGSHRIRYKFIRERHTDTYVVAQAFPLWQYRHHTLEFYMPSVAECDSDGELEEDILHELAHILLAPGVGNDAPTEESTREKIEFAVQGVTYALLWAREAGRKGK